MVQNALSAALMIDVACRLMVAVLVLLTAWARYWQPAPAWIETPAQRAEREEREHYARMRSMD